MKLDVSREEILGALRVCSAVSGHGGIVGLTADDAGLTLEAGGDTASARMVVGADVSSPGYTAVDARGLAAAAKGAGDSIEITLGDGSVLDLVGDDAQYSLVTIDGAPIMPHGLAIDELSTFSPALSEADVAAIARCVPCASSDPNRPNLCGVVVGAGKAYASDGYRLAMAELEHSGGELFLPLGAVCHLQALAELGPVAVRSSDALVELSTRGATVYGAQGAAEPPDFGSAQPADEDLTWVSCDLAAMRGALARVTGLSSGAVTVSLDDGRLCLEGAGDAGTSWADLAAAGEVTEEVSVLICQRMLTNHLKTCDGPEIRVGMPSELMIPVAIRCDAAGYTGYTMQRRQ